MFKPGCSRRSLAGGGLALLFARHPRAATAEVVIDDFAFQPAELRVAPGTTVVWINRDGSPHNVVSEATPPVFRSRLMDSGERFEQLFAEAGDFPYFCRLHPHMTGRVIVG